MTISSFHHRYIFQELRYYYQELKKGMLGPLTYYRTAKFRHDEELGTNPHLSHHQLIYIVLTAAGLPSALRPDLPVLFMWGTNDITTTPALINGSRKFIPRLQDFALEGRGHWVMVEAKDDVTEKVLNWLEGLSPNPSNKGKL